MQTLDWYYDLNTGELFNGPFEVPLNIPAPSGDWKEGGSPAGAKALVYACGGGCEDAAVRKVAYIERWKPGIVGATDMKVLIEGKLVRDPKDPASAWLVSGSPEGTKLRTNGRLGGSNWRTFARGSSVGNQGADHLMIIQNTGENIGMFSNDFAGVYQNGLSGITQVNDAKWHLWMAVGTGNAGSTAPTGQTAIYIDGKLVGTVTTRKSESGVFGIGNCGACPGQRFADRIDELVVMKTPIDATRALEIFNVGASRVR